MTITPLRTILFAGLLAGILDGVAAAVQSYVIRGTDPIVIFQYIASGTLGRAAFDGGLTTAGLGVVYHLTIAECWTVVFFFAYPSLAFLRKSRVLSGFGYGLFVWLIMNLVVVPLSRVPTQTLTVQNVFLGIVILIGTVGLPIAFRVHSHYSTARRQFA